MFDHILWLDLETRSRVNLNTHGAYRYRDCPDHRVLVAGYALGNGAPKAAIVGSNGALPLDLRNMLLDKRVQIRAHNAAFDRLQLKDAAPPIERWYCTAAQARAIALPGSLEDLGRAVGASIRKDPRGSELIKLLSIPQADGGFINDPTLMDEFARYCARDIETMRNVSLNMPDLRPEDMAAYWASERVNDRGMPIDVELCLLATQYAEAEAQEAASAVIKLSKGALATVRGTKLRDWVYARLDPTLRKHMEVWKRRSKRGKGAPAPAEPNGVAAPIGMFEGPMEKCRTLATDIRASLLDIAADDPDAIDPTVVEMIEAAEAGSMSSTSKFQTMLNRVGADGRLRGAFIFNGAYQTNRFSSTGAQLHNFPRLVAKDPEAVLARMRLGAPLDGVLRTLKSMLRPAITPGKGRMVVRADWSAIEARGLPWLVNSTESNAYLGAFTDDTRDIYVEQSHAAGLGGERQPGKVVVLSLGYGGGKGALAKMAKNYGVTIDDPDGVVVRWRRANGWVADKKTGWWASLQRCALDTMRGGPLRQAGRVTMGINGPNLTMTLPSGRVMHYPYAVLGEGAFGPEIEYLKASWKPKADATDWPKARLWHGILAENATQAACADLLRDALVRAERDGLEPIGHVHDEVITEASVGVAEEKGRALARCMLTAPTWAAGFPLKVEVDIAPRFRK